MRNKFLSTLTAGLLLSAQLVYGQAYQGPAIIKSGTTANHCVEIDATGGNVIKDSGSGCAGSGGVTSFNTRTGAVVLSSSDVTTALTFTPISGNQTITLSGDLTGSGATSIAGTLATVNTNTGSFGSTTSIPNFTVNGKGLITAAGSNVVIAPAGTLSGTTLNSTVVSSSLTSAAGGSFGTGAYATAYTLPTATSSVLGGVKPDGATITNTSGAISVNLTHVNSWSGAQTFTAGVNISGGNGITLGSSGFIEALANGVIWFTNSSAASVSLVLGSNTTSSPCITESGTTVQFVQGGSTSCGATLVPIQALTYNGNTFTSGTGTLTLGAGKTATISNTLTFTGTDSSSVAFGTGGTVVYANATTLSSLTTVSGGAFGTNAFTSTAYAPLASPGLTGTPTAPTAAASDNSTTIATTAHVNAKLAAPPAIGGTTPNTGKFTTIWQSSSNGFYNVLSTNSCSGVSSTPIMCGYGGGAWHVTPSFSGRIKCYAQLNMYSNSLSGGAFQIYEGTGTAPIAGAAATGTAIGALYEISNNGAGDVQGGMLYAEVTGLTLSTAVWFDIGYSNTLGAVITQGVGKCEEF